MAEDSPKPSNQDHKERENISIVALVLSIIGAFVFNIPVLGLALLIPALVIGHREYRRDKNNSMALAAIIIGWIGIAFQVLMLLFVIGMLVFFVFVATASSVEHSMDVGSHEEASRSTSVAEQAPRVEFVSLSDSGALTLMNTDKGEGLAVNRVQVTGDEGVRCTSSEPFVLSSMETQTYQIPGCNLTDSTAYQVFVSFDSGDGISKSMMVE